MTPEPEMKQLQVATEWDTEGYELRGFHYLKGKQRIQKRDSGCL